MCQIEREKEVEKKDVLVEYTLLAYYTGLLPLYQVRSVKLTLALKHHL